MLGSLDDKYTSNLPASAGNMSMEICHQHNFNRTHVSNH